MEIYKSKYVLLSIENLVYTILIISFTLILLTVIKKYLFKKSIKILNKKIAVRLFKIIKILFWTNAFNMIAILILRKITSIKLLETKFFLINIENLVYITLIILTTFIFDVIIKKYFLKKSLIFFNEELINQVFKIINIILWVISFSMVALVILRKATKTILIETKYFLISADNIILIILIPLFSILIISIIEILLFRDKNISEKSREIRRKIMVLLKYIFVIITINYVLRVIMKNPELINTYNLFDINGTHITIYNILYISIIISLNGLFIVGIKKFFNLQITNKKLDTGTGSAIFQITKYLLWIIAAVVVLQSAGFNISIILAGSAALLVGLGMGIQNVFSDVASGIILLIERPLKVSDIVKVDGIVGKVEYIGIRTTTVITRDDITMQIPNSKFTNEKIINWSNINNKTRFKIEVGVAYGSDVELVIKILKECAIFHKEVAKEPEPFIRFYNFGNSSLDFQLFFWSLENLKIENIQSDIRIDIDSKFRENNITIPFPQNDIHIIKN